MWRRSRPSGLHCLRADKIPHAKIRKPTREQECTEEDSGVGSEQAKPALMGRRIFSALKAEACVGAWPDREAGGPRLRKKRDANGVGQTVRKKAKQRHGK
ncbi:unnamed protein product [Pleuronectes platessa]|uniref:Uncharacterized protein n=1 Tax=Pleuronectes platessa TaxID=8262 RepID=A0A9N7YKY3_PLEPL|nr:unnamed protein product [Pleuronectes platessa]